MNEGRTTATVKLPSTPAGCKQSDFCNQAAPGADPQQQQPTTHSNHSRTRNNYNNPPSVVRLAAMLARLPAADSVKRVTPPRCWLKSPATCIGSVTSRTPPDTHTPAPTAEPSTRVNELGLIACASQGLTVLVEDGEGAGRPQRPCASEARSRAQRQLHDASGVVGHCAVVHRQIRPAEPPCRTQTIAALVVSG